MHELNRLFIRTEKQMALVNQIEELAKHFAARSEENDQNATFPFENFKDLKEAGILSLTIPKEYGGEEISLYDFLLLQETVARGDGPTALSLGWHLGIVMDLAERRPWNEDMFHKICQSIVKEGRLLNNASSEKATGSPTRGGKPQTTAEPNENGWTLNGRKTFTSLAPILDFFIVSATIDGSENVGNFLIPRDADGLRIEETWNTVGMRATRSDDLILENVRIENEALLEEKTGPKKNRPAGWLLHIPACYLGIAMAARDEAVRFAQEFKPNSLPGPIMEVPEVRRKTGEMDIALLEARHFMYSIAERWDTMQDNRPYMGPELAAVKTVATNAAIRVVDLAMRIVGGQSLFSSNPLQRYYRDVRGGLHNPPADDITLSILANRAFSK